MKHQMIRWGIVFVLGVLLTACAAPASEAVLPQSPTTTAAPETAAAENTVTPLPTPIPERSLVICLGQEPETLFLYGGASESMWSVLEAIYDGPFDQVNYETLPAILAEVPSVENGGVVFREVAVAEGDIIVDAEGSLTSLQSGVQVLPAGCTNPDCAVEWTSGVDLTMEQMQITFFILPGILWSDGETLTAQDSVYSFQVSADPAMPLARTRLERTAAYTAMDDSTVQWTGIAGYFPRDVDSFFWLPLPEHQWGSYSPAELLSLPLSAQTPLGWGAYVIDEWVAGDHITLSKNQWYFRQAEGLPAFDKVVFRFPGSTPYAYLDSIFIGECDVVDRTANLSAIAHDVRIAEIDGKVNLYLEQGPAITQLMIGQQPASYDDGYQVFQGDRADLFRDARMRRALAMCLDRGGIIRNILYDMTSIPQSYVPMDHPLYAADDEAIMEQDVEGAKALLTEIGWVENSTGVRTALGVAGIADGTELRVSLAVPGGEVNQAMLTEYLAPSLEACGFAVESQVKAMSDLYTPGPMGLVFGRQFDLAMITWFTGSDPACALYMSSQIPNEGNYWIGVNAGGYVNPAFDAACQSARQSRLDDLQAYQDGHVAAQRIFVEELPAIPLFYSITAAASRVDLCGFTLDASTRSDLWNLEAWDIRDDCIPQE